MERENNYINITLTGKAGKGALYFSLVDCLDETINDLAIKLIVDFYNRYPAAVGELTNYIASFRAEHYATPLEVTARDNSPHPVGPAVANAFIFRYSVAGNLTLEDLGEYPDRSTTYLLNLEQGCLTKLKQVEWCGPQCREITTYNAAGQVTSHKRVAV